MSSFTVVNLTIAGIGAALWFITADRVRRELRRREAKIGEQALIIKLFEEQVRRLKDKLREATNGEMRND